MFKGYIYFIADTIFNEVKIGYSANPQKRLKELQTARSNELTLLKVIPGNQKEERKYHSQFCWYRKKKGEWFDLSDENKTFIAR